MYIKYIQRTLVIYLKETDLIFIKVIKWDYKLMSIENYDSYNMS